MRRGSKSRSIWVVSPCVLTADVLHTAVRAGCCRARHVPNAFAGSAPAFAAFKLTADGASTRLMCTRCFSTLAIDHRVYADRCMLMIKGAAELDSDEDKVATCARVQMKYWYEAQSAGVQLQLALISLTWPLHSHRIPSPVYEPTDGHDLIGVSRTSTISNVSILLQ